MPNICESDDNHPFAPSGPEDPTEGPWFHLGADQVRKIARIVGGHPHGAKVEYRGADYWEVTLLDPENQPLGSPQMVFPHEVEVPLDD